MEAEMKEQVEEKLPDGFITKEEWVDKGRAEEDWRSPEEFVERGEKILPIVKERKEKLEKQVAEMQRDMKVILAFNEQEAKRNRDVGYSEAMTVIDDKKKEAVENADWDAVKAEDEKRDKLVEEHRRADVPENVESEAFITFKENNSDWFGTDKEMTEWVDSAGVGILNKCNQDGLSEEDAFKKVEEETRARFPSKFQNKNRDKESTVESEAKGKTRPTSKKTWDNVSNEGKASYKRVKDAMELKGRKFSKEDYMKDYFA